MISKLLKLILDSRVYLYPQYTLLYEEAISGLSLLRENEEDPSRTDLATGASTMYRYLAIERGSVPKICDVILLRKKQGVGVPRGGMYSRSKCGWGD